MSYVAQRHRPPVRSVRQQCVTIAHRQPPTVYNLFDSMHIEGYILSYYCTVIIRIRICIQHSQVIIRTHIIYAF